MTSTLIIVDPEIQIGASAFVGAHMPVQDLFDYLEEGDAPDIFLAQFPSVTRWQAVGFLTMPRCPCWPLRGLFDESKPHYLFALMLD